MPKSRSEEHTSELQSPDQHSFPTRRSSDLYMKYPDDETFPQLIVNYVKLPTVPRFDQDWTPLAKALRGGDYFVSTGEVLLRNWALEGSGAKRTYNAEVEIGRAHV